MTGAFFFIKIEDFNVIFENLFFKRYIPNRVGSSIEVSHYLFQKENSKENAEPGGSNSAESCDNLVDNIKRRLIIDTCNGIPEKSKVLNLHNKQSDSSDNGFAENIKMYNSSVLRSVKKAGNRVIPTAPFRILDAPDFKNDYCKFFLYYIINFFQYKYFL